MAADLIMPTMPNEQQQSLHFLPQRPPHSRAQSFQLPTGAGGPQISPSSGHSSPHNLSTPASPRAGVMPSSAGPGAFPNSRHARPLYMPAALRPNEFPSRAPKSKPSSTDNSDAESDTTLRRSTGSIINNSALGVLGKALSRRGTAEQSPEFGDDWDLDLFPEVTAHPTRNHWKPDAESSICDDPTCKRTFNTFFRRHHCRKCGNIFCDWHSSFAAPLDQHANFNPRAPLSRTCNHCFDLFKVWHRQTPSQSGSGLGSSPSSSENNYSAFGIPVAKTPGGAALALPHGPEAAASVPRDWNWSTF